MPGQQGPVTNPRIAKLIELEVAGKIKPEHQQELDTYRAQGLAPKKSSGNNLTEYQGKSTGFYERAAGADADFLAAGAGGEPVGYGGDVARAVLPKNVVNSNTSPERQKAQQAKEDFIRASLRYESGAAIGQDEFTAQDRIFFPQTGDSAEVIAQKAAARKRVIDSLKVAAGPGVDAKRIAPPAANPAGQPSPDDKDADGKPFHSLLGTDWGVRLEAALGARAQEFEPLDNDKVRFTYADGHTEDRDVPPEFKNSTEYGEAYKKKFGEDAPLAMDVTATGKAGNYGDEKYGGHLEEAIQNIKKDPIGDVGSAAQHLHGRVVGACRGRMHRVRADGGVPSELRVHTLPG